MFLYPLDDPATAVRAVVNTVKRVTCTAVGALEALGRPVVRSADVVVLGGARLAPRDCIADAIAEKVGVVVGAVAVVADRHAVDGHKLVLLGDRDEGVAGLHLVTVHEVEVEGALGGIDVVGQNLCDSLDEPLVIGIGVHGVGGTLGDALALEGFKVVIVPIKTTQDEADGPVLIRGVKLFRIAVGGIKLEIARKEVDDYRENLLRHARENVIHVVHRVVDALGEARLVVPLDLAAVTNSLVVAILKRGVAVAVLAVLLKKVEGVAQNVIIGVVHMSCPISLCPLCFYIIIITCYKPAVKVNCLY